MCQLTESANDRLHPMFQRKLQCSKLQLLHYIFHSSSMTLYLSVHANLPPSLYYDSAICVQKLQKPSAAPQQIDSAIRTSRPFTNLQPLQCFHASSSLHATPSPYLACHLSARCSCPSALSWSRGPKSASGTCRSLFSSPGFGCGAQTPGSC